MLAHDTDVRITIMDLPVQLKVARKNIEEAGLSDRFNAYPADVLKAETSFYKGADVIWMSQFLDCFSEEEILGILRKAAAVMDEKTEPSRSSELIILLPGIHDKPADFVTKHFISDAREAGVQADFLTIDSHVGYFENSSIVQRLHTDIILPAKKSWLSENLAGRCFAWWFWCAIICHKTCAGD